MPDRTGIFLGWSANLSNFLGLGVEAGASPMYPQKNESTPHPPGKITAQLISAFVFATRIVQLLFFVNPKFQASDNLM